MELRYLNEHGVEESVSTVLFTKYSFYISYLSSISKLKKYGRGGEIRTPDLLLPKQAR